MGYVCCNIVVLACYNKRHLGGTDSTRFTGSITSMYVSRVETLVKALIHVSSPITSTSPSSQFWGINQSVRYGTSTSILTTTAGIIDTGKQKASQILQIDHSINTPGTTLILLATNGLTKYKAATGAVLDSVTGLLRITSAQFSALQSLFFIAGGVRGILFSISKTDSHGFQSILICRPPLN